MKIKTAKEILDSKIFESLKPDSIYKTEPIIEAMKEYAEQFIDLAAEKANLIHFDTVYDKKESLDVYHGYEGYNDDFIIVEVNKESILKIKKQIK